MTIDDLVKNKVSPETSEIKGDTWSISLPKTRIHTLEELLEYAEVDQSVWEVTRFICNKWEMGSKDKDGDAVVTPLFQVKAFLEKRRDVEAVKKEIESLKELAKEFPWPEFEHAPKANSGLMLELNVPDVHWGKQAWQPETGGPNYDTKIANATYLRAVEALLDRVKGYKFDSILYIVGNDALNSDDIEGRTTAGTYVSTDGRYHKTFGIVRDTTIWTIKRLQQIASKVKVISCPGNHDRLSAWHLVDSVAMYFHNDDSVEVDNLPRPRKYHQFGEVMLGFCHGDKGKRTDYPLLMATDEPEMFGKSKFREMHTGHTHMTKLDEQHGVRVRVLPALCPADDWHNLMGFVHNIRSAEAYVWDKKEGLISVVYYNEKD